MTNVTISTTLPIEIYKEIKDRRMSFNGLILEGLRANEKVETLAERVRDLEEYENDHITTIRELRGRLAVLEATE